MIGSITHQIDLVEVLLVAFTLFFFALVLYLQRESKREGYPLEEEIPTLGHGIVGFPNAPPPKTYNLMDGGTTILPQEYERRELKARPRAFHSGAALYPIGDPLLAGIGPGSYTLRRDEPWKVLDGSNAVEPLRVATDYICRDLDMDPRGRRMLGLDFAEAGTCVDIWVDKDSKILRYLEVELNGGAGRRLVPSFYAVIRRNTTYVQIDCITGAQFVKAPALRQPTVLTAREEDFINGFFAGGYIYSEPYKEALL